MKPEARAHSDRIRGNDHALALELLARLDTLIYYQARIAEGLELLRGMRAIIKQVENLVSKFDDELARLGSDVTAIETVVPAAVTVIGELAAKFKANANDPSKVTELADRLEATKTALATAVAAGTAAETETPPAPTPDPTPAPAPTDPPTT